MASEVQPAYLPEVLHYFRISKCKGIEHFTRQTENEFYFLERPLHERQWPNELFIWRALTVPETL